MISIRPSSSSTPPLTTTINNGRDDDGDLILNKSTIHDKVYHDLRDNTDLPANFVVRAYSKAIEAMKSTVAEWQKGNMRRSRRKPIRIAAEVLSFRERAVWSYPAIDSSRWSSNRSSMTVCGVFIPEGSSIPDSSRASKASSISSIVSAGTISCSASMMTYPRSIQKWDCNHH